MTSLAAPMTWAANRLRRSPAIARVALSLIPDTHWHVDLPEIGRFRIRLRRNRSLWLRPTEHTRVVSVRRAENARKAGRRRLGRGR